MRKVCAILAALLALSLCSCHREPVVEENNILDDLPPVIEDPAYKAPEPAPPLEVKTEGIKLLPECVLAESAEAQSVDEFVEGHRGTGFNVYAGFEQIPYDGNFYVADMLGQYIGIYATSGDIDFEKLEQLLGIVLTQADVDMLVKDGVSHYDLEDGTAYVDYTEQGWCFVRGVANNNISWEGVS